MFKWIRKNMCCCVSLGKKKYKINKSVKSANSTNQIQNKNTKLKEY